MVLASMVSSSPPAPPDYLDPAKRMRKAIHEIAAINWRIMGTDKNVRALQHRDFLVNQVQVCWRLQGDPQYAFVPAGSNHRIEITLVPRQLPVVGEDTKGFFL